MTLLDKELRQLAKENTEAFFQLLPESAIVRAKVCYILKGGKTQSQAAKKLNLSKRQVQYMGCKGC